jgi:hypothetical protein
MMFVKCARLKEFTIQLIIKPGELNLSRRGLVLSWCGFNRDSLSRHWQKVSLDGRIILTISKSLSWRSRNLDFVLKPSSSPKCLDNREICRDMKFLANLDSLYQTQSRVSQFYHIFLSRFLNLSRFLSLKYLKKSQ